MGGTTGQQDICPEYFAQFRHALTDTPRESSRRYLAPRHDGFAVKLNLIPATFLRCAYNHHTWSTMRIRQYPAFALAALLLLSAYLGLAPQTLPSYKQSDKVLHFVTFLLITVFASLFHE